MGLARGVEYTAVIIRAYILGNMSMPWSVVWRHQGEGRGGGDGEGMGEATDPGMD